VLFGTVGAGGDATINIRLVAVLAIAELGLVWLPFHALQTFQFLTVN
jgi:hypothetical protein